MNRCEAFFSLVVITLFISSVQAQTISLRQLGSGLHIELQPQTDHHRIRFRLRCRNFAGKRVFARIETEASGLGNQNMIVREVNVSGNLEDWDFFMRVPKSTKYKCEYTLLLGETNNQKVDPRLPLSGFKWIVNRDQAGNAQIVTSRMGMPLPIVVTERIADITPGGKIEIKIQQRVMIGNAINFGVKNNQNPVEYGLQKVN